MTLDVQTSRACGEWRIDVAIACGDFRVYGVHRNQQRPTPEDEARIVGATYGYARACIEGLR